MREIEEELQLWLLTQDLGLILTMESDERQCGLKKSGRRKGETMKDEKDILFLRLKNSREEITVEITAGNINGIRNTVPILPN